MRAEVFHGIEHVAEKSGTALLKALGKLAEAVTPVVVIAVGLFVIGRFVANKTIGDNKPK